MNWTVTTRLLAREARRHAAPLLVACGVTASALLPTSGSGPRPDPVDLPDGVAAWSLQAETASEPVAVPRHLFRIPVTVTGYSSTTDQTDSTPFITASNTRVRRGIIALSRDLLREFTPGAPYAFGDLVDLEGMGVFRVEDTMAKRYRNRADIWFTTRTAAMRWGRQTSYASKITDQAGRQEIRIRNRGPLPVFESALTD